MRTLLVLALAAGLVPAATPNPKSAARAKALVAEAKDSFQSERKIAVIAAVGRYDSLSQLRYTLADAQELGEELTRQGYTVYKLINNEATSDQIRAKLDMASSILDKEKGTLLFFFSGHGFQDNAGRNFLAAYGTTVSNLAQEGLPVAEVEQKLVSSGAKRRILIIDACRNSTGAKTSTEAPRSFARLDSASGTGILYSTRAGLFSYEDPALGHGVFTNFLLEGLRGKAAGSDGLVTLFDLANYVNANVESYASKQGWVQVPHLAGELSSDFLIASAGPAKIDPQAPRNSIQVDADALVFKSSENKNYFATIADGNIVLYNAADLSTFASLSPTDKKTSQGVIYRGTAGGEEVEVVPMLQNNVILALNGRIGKRCPNTACPPNTVLLPGEQPSTATTVNNAARKAGALARGLGGMLGNRGGQVFNDVTRVTTQTELTSQTLAAQSGTHLWRPFQLAILGQKK